MPLSFRDVMFRLPAAYVARSGWPALGAVVAGVIIFIGATLAGAAAMGLMASVLDIPVGSLATMGEGDQTQVRVFILTLVVQQAAMIWLTVFFADRFGGRAAEVLALDHRPSQRSLYLGSFALMAMLLIGLDLVGLAIGPKDVVNDLKPFAKLITSDSWWLTLLAVGVGAPLSEELLFRGFLFSALAQTRLGPLGATALTTAAWTALHGNYSAFGMFEVAVIGCFLSWLLWRTGSLWVPIFCHAVYNSALTLMLAVVPLPA